MNVSIIGNGRLGQNLALALKQSGHRVVEMYARDKQKLNNFCKPLGIKPLEDLTLLNSGIDVLIISVTDIALVELVEQISGDFVVAHTSGSVSLSVYDKTKLQNYGVFYPLYSFSAKPIKDFKEVPILIETNHQGAKKTLLKLAKSLSNKVSICTSEEREKIHLVAVFVNNFVNFILSDAQDLAACLGADFKYLEPILQQTIGRIGGEQDIFTLQSGPAVRKDQTIIDKHLTMLEDFPRQRALYDFLTQKIQNKLSLRQ